MAGQLGQLKELSLELTCIELGICEELHELRAILWPDMVACRGSVSITSVHEGSYTLEMPSDLTKCSWIAIDIESPDVGNIVVLVQLILEEAREIGWSCWSVEPGESSVEPGGQRALTIRGNGGTRETK